MDEIAARVKADPMAYRLGETMQATRLKDVVAREATEAHCCANWEGSGEASLPK